MLSSTETLHLLDCDDSDEDALFDIDVEDEVVLANNVPTYEKEHVTVEIVDPDVILPEPVEGSLPIWDINFKWSESFPLLVLSVKQQQVEESGEKYSYSMTVYQVHVAYLKTHANWILYRMKF